MDRIGRSRRARRQASHGCTVRTARLSSVTRIEEERGEEGMSAEFAGSRGCSRWCIKQGGARGEGGHGVHLQVLDRCSKTEEGVPGGDEGSRRERGVRGRGGTRAIGRRGPRAARSSGALAMAVAPCRR